MPNNSAVSRDTSSDADLQEEMKGKKRKHKKHKHRQESDPGTAIT